MQAFQRRDALYARTMKRKRIPMDQIVGHFKSKYTAEAIEGMLAELKRRGKENYDRVYSNHAYPV